MSSLERGRVFWLKVEPCDEVASFPTCDSGAAASDLLVSIENVRFLGGEGVREARVIDARPSDPRDRRIEELLRFIFLVAFGRGFKE